LLVMAGSAVYFSSRGLSDSHLSLLLRSPKA
jgi:hypothetical protein